MDPAALYHQAKDLYQAGRLDEAARAYEALLAFAPDHPETLYMRGLVDVARGGFAEAAVWLDRATQAKPDFAAAYLERAKCAVALRDPATAVNCVKRVLALDAGAVSALKILANALNDLQRYDEALVESERVLALAPGTFSALFARAVALAGLGRKVELIAACERALAVKPNSKPLLRLRALYANQVLPPREALAVYEAALSVDPDAPMFRGEAVHLRMRLCLWDGIDEEIDKLLADIDAGKYASNPFYLLGLPATPAQLRAGAQAHFNHLGVAPGPAPRATPGAGRIRIGYFSSDFDDHPVGQVILPLLEAHDRSRFEVLGFALAGDPAGAMRKRIMHAMDGMNDVAGKTDEEIVDLARAASLDIAVDLNGYTAGARASVFARRVAPVQVNFLGYPGTLGAPAWDYIVGDLTTTPFANREDFSERIVQLPHTYFIGSRAKLERIKPFARAKTQLPEGAIVFCGFHRHYKITPDVFDIWMRVLGVVDNAVLWLMTGKHGSDDNLRREAQRRGIAPERLIFARPTSGLGYLARQQFADLFLDTFHYNAHSTASDALMMGLPVLTKRGDTFASRAASSLVAAAGLPELVASDAAQYESMAILLARDPTMLASLRRRLEQNGPSSALFDTQRKARNIERAYAEMVRRSRASLPPEEFAVDESMPI